MSKLFLVLVLGLACISITHGLGTLRLDFHINTNICSGELLPLRTWPNGTECVYTGGTYNNIYCSPQGTPYGTVCTHACPGGNCRSIGTSTARWGETYCFQLNPSTLYSMKCLLDSTPSPAVGEPIVASPRSSTPVASPVTSPTSSPPPPANAPTTTPTSTSPTPTVTPSPNPTPSATPASPSPTPTPTPASPSPSPPNSIPPTTNPSPITSPTGNSVTPTGNSPNSSSAQSLLNFKTSFVATTIVLLVLATI